jgi:hypothetical protein
VVSCAECHASFKRVGSRWANAQLRRGRRSPRAKGFPSWLPISPEPRIPTRIAHRSGATSFRQLNAFSVRGYPTHGSNCVIRSSSPGLVLPTFRLPRMCPWSWCRTCCLRRLRADSSRSRRFIRTDLPGAGPSSAGRPVRTSSRPSFSGSPDARRGAAPVRSVGRSRGRRAARRATSDARARR